MKTITKEQIYGDSQKIDEFETINVNSFKSYLQLSFNLFKRKKNRWKFIALISTISLLWSPIIYAFSLIGLMLINFVLIVLQKIL